MQVIGGIELCEAVEQQDQQLVGHLLPVIKQRTDDATQALSDCLEVKDLIVYWYITALLVHWLFNMYSGLLHSARGASSCTACSQK